MNTKKTFLIIVFVILVLAFGALIYFVFIKDLVAPGNGNENENVNVSTNENTNAGLPVINGVTNVNGVTANVNGITNFGPAVVTNQEAPDTSAQGGKTLAKTAVESSVKAAEPVATGDGIRYYDEVQDKFFILLSDGTTQEMSDKSFPEADEIRWSPVDDEAVIMFPDQSKIVYNFDTNEQVTLPNEWDDVEFSPDGSKLGFKNISDQESARWLAISNTDGSEVNLIEPLGDNQGSVNVNWSPSGQVVALFSESYGIDGQEVYPIGLFGENFKSIVTDGRGFEGLWSPSGDQLLYSVYSADSRYNPKLHLVNATGDQTGSDNMDLELQTWVSRCVFTSNGNFVYCAVPEYLESGSGLYPELATTTNDTLYKINTATGVSNPIALPSFFGGDRDYAIESLALSNDGSYLYFSDSITGQLFEINL